MIVLTLVFVLNDSASFKHSLIWNLPVPVSLLMYKFLMANLHPCFLGSKQKYEFYGLWKQKSFWFVQEQDGNFFVDVPGFISHVPEPLFFSQKLPLHFSKVSWNFSSLPDTEWHTWFIKEAKWTCKELPCISRCILFFSITTHLLPALSSTMHLIKSTFWYFLFDMTFVLQSVFDMCRCMWFIIIIIIYFVYVL